MKLRILVLSACRDLCDHAGRKKLALIPESTRKQDYFKGAHLDLQAVHVQAAGDVTAVEQVVHELVQNLDGILILCEVGLVEAVGHLASCCFLCTFESSTSPERFGNLLGRALSRSMRSFAAYSRRFDDLKYQKIFILPANNFSSAEFTELKDSFGAGAIGTDFPGRMERALKAMRKHQRPKVQRPDARVFYVDDRDLFFEYGNERHARFATAHPHGLLCTMNGYFRFGRRFDPERHFNVSRDNMHLSHEFTDCHGEPHVVAGRTHANVFPNDFVA